MNYEGGVLVVGVDDNCMALGLDKDFEVLGKKKSWDEWVHHFVHLFNNYIGVYFICKTQEYNIQ